MYYCWYCPDVLDIHSIFGQYLITPSVGLCVRPRTTQICSKFRFQFVNLVETHMVVWIGNADREWVICNETGNSIHAKWGILNWTHSIRCIFGGCTRKPNIDTFSRQQPKTVNMQMGSPLNHEFLPITLNDFPCSGRRNHLPNTQGHICRWFISAILLLSRALQSSPTNHHSRHHPNPENGESFSNLLKLITKLC